LDISYDDDFSYARQRQRMVQEQLARRDIRSPSVLEAMRSTPRHLFVAPEYRQNAYSDGPLPIGFGQTISQPYIVALMTQLLALRGNEVVLEVGTGSGYQAAILGQMAREVHTIERHAGLARAAAHLLEQLQLNNIHVHIGDGSLGLPEFAPYQGILVTAAAPEVPPALLEQLADGGRLVIPIGPRGCQILEVWQRHGAITEKRELIPVAFVPLIGEFGWED
jgi:protein-L-isoaspartate(D-aspartate) O-methyltransferase